MKFDKIKIKNFLAIGEAEIDLDNQGFVSITGVNRTDSNIGEEISNGSGKSSIVEAIAWCLSGQTLRGTKDVQNYYTDGDCEVQIEFAANSHKYKIVRTKGKSIEFYEDGEYIGGKGIRETNEIILSMFPEFDPENIGSTIIIGQGMPNAFTNNGGAKRKEILEHLAQSDYQIDELKNKLTESREKAQQDLRKYENAKLVNDTVVEVTKEGIVKRKQELLQQYATLHQYETRAADISSSFEKEKAAIAEKIETATHVLQELETRGSETSKRLQSAIEQQKKEQDEIERTYDREMAEIAQQYSSRITEANLSITETERTIEGLQARKIEIQAQLQKRLMEISDSNEVPKLRGMLNGMEDNLKQMKAQTGKCPTCGRPLDGFVKPDTSKIENEIARTRDLIHKYTAEIEERRQKAKQEYDIQIHEIEKQIEEKKNDKRVLELKLNGLTESQSEQQLEIRKKCVAAKEQITKANLIEEITRKLNSEREEYRQALARIQNGKEEMNALVLKKSSLLQSVEDARKAIAESEANIRSDEKKVEECEKICKQHESSVQRMKDKIDIINKLYSFATKEFRTLLLEDVIVLLEQKAKKMCQIAFGDDKINFRQENGGIFIGYRDKPLENLSGGEGQIVKLLIQLALRETLIEMRGQDFNMIWLDEIFDALDEERAGRAVDLANSLNVSSIFIISHRANLQLPSDKEIVVEKIKDVAYIK